MHGFDYRRPQELKEALTLKSAFGDASRLLAGGTDLILAIEGGTSSPEVLIDLKGIRDLDRIEERDDVVEIGAGVTYTALIDSPLVRRQLPGLWESSRLVASVGIRNVATMVGNICNAVPSAESAAPLLVRDALVRIASSDGTRQVPITAFFTGPRRTVVGESEIVTGVGVPVKAEPFGACYVKLGRYRGEDIAQAAVSVFVDKDRDWRVAFAAVGPVPVRATEAEECLKGRDATPEAVAEAVALIDDALSPITDIRASREYRLHMCRVMFEKAVMAAGTRLTSSEPPYGARLI